MADMRIADLAPSALVDAADAVFGTERGRGGSVAERWPNLFGPAADGRCLGVVEDQNLVSGLLVQPMPWICDGEERLAHQVGFVLTRPAWRGRGLMAAVLRALAERHPGPMVLWSAHPDIYLRHGWTLADDGGELAQWRGAPTPDAPAAVPLAQVDHAALDTMRAAWAPRRKRRRPADWRIRPFGTQRMLAAIGQDGYVLFGQSDTRAVVHDIVGDGATVSRLWPTVTRQCDSVTVNLCRDHPARPWLTGQLGLVPVAKPLACWWQWPQSLRLFLPWFDRI